jgi:hypothetical protein
VGNLPVFGKDAEVVVVDFAGFFAGVGATAFVGDAPELVFELRLRCAVDLVGERLADKLPVGGVSALPVEVEDLMILGLRAGGFLSRSSSVFFALFSLVTMTATERRNDEMYLCEILWHLFVVLV